MLAPEVSRSGSLALQGPERLIREAQQGGLGIEFLLCAPFETAAITFGVHPDVVLAARAILEGRGIRPDPSVLWEE